MNFGKSNIFLILISAILMGISQHPINLGFISYIALVPIIPLLLTLRYYKDALKIGLLWGLVYNFTTVYWIASNIGTSPLVAFLTMIISVLILTIIPIMIIVLLCMMNRRGLSIYILSLIWPSIELIRSYGTLGFPWTSLSNSQLNYNLLIQNVEFVGMYGITFLIVLINILIYKLLLERRLKNLIILAFVVIIPILSGKIIKSSIVLDNGDAIKILSVQPNIHLSEKWEQGSQNKILAEIIDQTNSALDSTINLIIWPETSTISYVFKNDMNYNRIKLLLENKNTKLITGMAYFKEDGSERNYYNSVGYFGSEGMIELYHKIHLVPGAEYVPLSDIIKSLDFFNIGLGNFSHGKEFMLFDIDDNKFASMICLESIFPYLSREFVMNGANFLVYVVNDGWYEKPPEPQQHANRVIYRAIETRRPIIRCANTGVSMIIDKFGNITNQLELNKEGVIVANIVPSKELTFYVRYGDIFIYFMILIIILSMFKTKRYEEYI